MTEEVKRYDHAVGWGGEGSMMAEAVLGDYVLYSDLLVYKRALDLATKLRILALNPNCPTNGVKQKHIDEDVALFLKTARQERTKNEQS